ncbi:hypothetical protein ACGFMM_02395 [Streptomyces sp. NPDC048604]|uniref:hypothetical protein n=1 Tax=Streptomyces sp. NPDC048604 TaxID=3365578 RepID=UPI003714FE44
MVTQSNKRFSEAELEYARVNDDRERAVHSLTQLLPTTALEDVLQRLGVRDAALAGLPPLTAALRFQDAALEQARSEGLTAEQIRELAASAAHGRTHDSRPAPEPLFDRAIFIFGLRRGANHAISEWVRGHFDESEVRYLNSAEISLFETDGRLLTVDRDTYTRMAIEPHERTLIVGYENLDPSTFPLHHNAQVAHRSDVVVVLRDFPNTAASIARQAQSDPAWAYRYRIRDLLDLWKRYAGYLEARSFGFTYVTFNAWFNDTAERRRISEALGLEHSDRGLNTVSSFGQGSSFDGLHHDGRAQDMAVLNRWKTMLDDRLFQFMLLADEETLEINQRLFGDFPHDRAELLDRWSAGGPAR